MAVRDLWGLIIQSEHVKIQFLAFVYTNCKRIEKLQKQQLLLEHNYVN